MTVHFVIVDEKAEKRTDYDAMGADVMTRRLTAS